MRKLLFLLLLPIILCSCLEVYWVNPVSDVQNAVVDERIIGTWFRSGKISSGGKISTYSYLHIGKPDANSMEMICQFIENQEIEGWINNTMHISELDGRRFMNIRAVIPDLTLSNVFFIIEYEMKERDELLVRFANPDFVDNAIRSQVLLGAGPDVGVLSDSSVIRQFIRNSQKDQLFPTIPKSLDNECCKFKRLRF